MANKTPNFQAIIYDLDGTLVDSFKDIATAANCGLASCGKEPLTLEEWISLVGFGIRNLFRWALAGGKDEDGNPIGPEPEDEMIDKAITAMRAYYAEHPVVYSKPYPSVMEVLAEFAALGIKQGVLSNKPDDLAKQTVEKLDLDKNLEIVLGDTPDFPPKPDPTSLKHLLERFGVDGDSALMVGDADADFCTARGAGIPICLVTYGSRSKDFLAPLNPDWLLDDFASLKDIVLGNGNITEGTN